MRLSLAVQNNSLSRTSRTSRTDYLVLQAMNAQRPGNKARNRVGIYVFKGIIVVTGVCMMGGHNMCWVGMICGVKPNMCRVGMICGVKPRTGKGVVITGFILY